MNDAIDRLRALFNEEDEAAKNVRKRATEADSEQIQLEILECLLQLRSAIPLVATLVVTALKPDAEKPNPLWRDGY